MGLYNLSISGTEVPEVKAYPRLFFRAYLSISYRHPEVKAQRGCCEAAVGHGH